LLTQENVEFVSSVDSKCKFNVRFKCVPFLVNGMSNVMVIIRSTFILQYFKETLNFIFGLVEEDIVEDGIAHHHVGYEQNIEV